MVEKIITHCISTYRNLPYLKLAVASVRENSFYKNQPFIVHSDENNDDGTNEWLIANKEKYNLTVYIENLNPTGIGPGMNFVASKVTTKFINFLHSDFVVARNWDLYLHKRFNFKHDIRLRKWVNSYRIEPNMFNNNNNRPGTSFIDLDIFGSTYKDFDQIGFMNYAEEFIELNDKVIPKGEGVSGMVRKVDWDFIGGNDEQFTPTSWDDIDLFLRMRNAGFIFEMPTKSVVWHFGARGSHRLEENEGRTSVRQEQAELDNIVKFKNKWKGLPKYDKWGMVEGIR